MDNLVFNKFHLRKSQLDRELENELMRIKNEAAGKNAYHSGACLKMQCEALVKNCSLKLDALIKVYEEIENEIQQGYLVKNEANIRREFNEVLSSEYSVCDHRLAGLYNEFKVGRSDVYTFPQIREEAERKLDILIESARRKGESKKQLSQSSNSNEEEYNISEESFKYTGTLKSEVRYKCFVIMPIGDKDKNPIEYKNNMAVFNKIVKPCVEKSGYEINCYHADDELVTRTGDISKRIFTSIQDDEIAIVDLRRQNPNVIYEMCVRHIFGKRTILICSDLSQNFFHSTKYTALKYFINGYSNQEFYRRLQVVIEDVIQRPEQSDNPIRDSLGKSLAQIVGEKIEDKAEASAIEGLSKVAQDILLQCIKDDKSEFIDEYMVIALSQTKMNIEIGCDELIERELIDQSYANYGDETHYILSPKGRKMADLLSKKVYIA